MPPRIPTEALLADIRRVYEQLGSPPSESEYNEYGEYSASAVRNRFGTFTSGREAADIHNPDMRGGQNRIAQDDLLDAIHELATAVEGTPTREQMNELGRFAEKPYRRAFGSWSEALLAAGFDYDDLNRAGSHIAKTVTVSCTICGTTETRLKSDIEGVRNVFCSQECLHTWRSEEFTGDDHPLSNKVTFECDWCGEQRRRRPSVVNIRYYNFCDVECMGEWRSKHRSGDQAPAWKGGGEFYRGENWLSQREACLERDDYECQECGLSEAEHFNEYGRQLEVHHKTAVREFYKKCDGKPDFAEMNALTNLVTLCIPCHSRK